MKDLQAEVFENIVEKISEETKGIRRSFWHDANRPGEFLSETYYQDVRQGLFHILSAILSEHPNRIKLCACGCGFWFFDETKSGRKRCLNKKHAARVRKRRERGKPDRSALSPERNQIIVGLWNRKKVEVQEVARRLPQGEAFRTEMDRMIAELEGEESSHG